jgi:hypothetical protein
MNVRRRLIVSGLAACFAAFLLGGFGFSPNFYPGAGYWPGGLWDGVQYPMGYYAQSAPFMRSYYQGQTALMAAPPPGPMLPAGLPYPGMTPGVQAAAGNQQAAYLAGTRMAGPYVVNANPSDPYNAQTVRVPQPGVMDIQTNCPTGQGWYVPSTGRCSSTPWIPGVDTYFISSNGVAYNVPTNQMGPMRGGVPGVPGVSQPYQQPMMAPGFGGFPQQPFVGQQPGVFQPGFQQPFFDGFQPGF